MIEKDLIFKETLHYLVGISVQTNCTEGIGDESSIGHRRFTLSGSLFSFGGKWMIATAGHSVDDLNRMIRDGFKVRISLIDSLNEERVDSRLVPLPYDPDLTATFTQGGLDCAFIELPDNTRSLLKINGVRAIDEAHWDFAPNDDEYQVCAVLGLPLDGQAITPKSGREVSLGLSPTMVRLEYKFEIPEEILRPDVPLWYARVPRSEFRDAPFGMNGMSGGPVFGFWRTINRSVRFQVIGLQFGVRNHGQFKYFLVTPFYVIGQLLKEFRRVVLAETAATR